MLEEALEQREDDVRPRVPHVDAPVDGRAAGVDADAAGLARLDRHDLTAQRVLDAQLAHAREATQRERRPKLGPAQLALELRGERQQGGLLAVAAHELHADREAVVAPPTGTEMDGWPVRFHSSAKG